MQARLTATLLAAALGVIMCPAQGRASLIFSLPNLSVQQGSAGSFDVTLQNTGTDAVDIGGFSFGIGTGNAGISFNSATTATIDPYIYAGDSEFGPDITISFGQSLIASDNPADNVAAVLGANATVALGRVNYTIGRNASTGSFATSFSVDATSLADAVGDNIPGIVLVNGQVTVLGVPEPDSWRLLVAGLLLLAVVEFRDVAGKRRRT